MARIEIWYKCPCGVWYTTQKEAIKCAVSHVVSGKFAVGSHKSVRVYDNHAANSLHGMIGALREADLSDIIDVRKKQLTEMEVNYENQL